MELSYFLQMIHTAAMYKQIRNDGLGWHQSLHSLTRASQARGVWGWRGYFHDLHFFFWGKCMFVSTCLFWHVWTPASLAEGWMCWSYCAAGSVTYRRGRGKQNCAPRLRATWNRSCSNPLHTISALIVHFSHLFAIEAWLIKINRTTSIEWEKQMLKTTCWLRQCLPLK